MREKSEKTGRKVREKWEESRRKAEKSGRKVKMGEKWEKTEGKVREKLENSWRSVGGRSGWEKGQGGFKSGRQMGEN